MRSTTKPLKIEPQSYILVSTRQLEFPHRIAGTAEIR